MAQKILIIQTAFIGDALLSIPLLKNLKKFYPEAELTYLCRKGMGDLLSRLSLVNEVLEVDKSNSKNFKAVQKRLKATKWDWIICPHESFRSQILVHGLVSPRKTSYKQMLNGVTFNERVERPMDLPEALRSVALLQVAHPELKTSFENFRKQNDQLRKIDFKISTTLMEEFGLKRADHKNIIRDFRKVPEEFSMEIEYFAELRSRKREPSEKVKAILNNVGNRKLYVIAPGSVWETKIWRREYYRQICEKLSKDAFVLLIGGPPERALCADLLTGLSNVYNAAGETSLWESAELLACSDQILTNDSGAMHLASLSSASLLAVFGPTILEQGYRPWNNHARTIESTIYCRPCGKHGAKKCPLNNHACMKLVDPEHVMGLLT